MSGMISIRLTFLDPKTKQRTMHMVRDLDPNRSIMELRQICLEQFWKPSMDLVIGKKGKRKVSSTPTLSSSKNPAVKLLIGFPPKPVVIENFDSVDSSNKPVSPGDTRSVADCGIENQSNIVVNFIDSDHSTSTTKATNESVGARKINDKGIRGKKTERSGSTLKTTDTVEGKTEVKDVSASPSKAKTSHDKAANENDDNIISSKRPRRAAAKAASKSFVEVDKAMRKLEQESKRKATTNGISSTSLSRNARSRTNSNNASPKRTNVKMGDGPGRSLASGETVVPASPSSNASSRKRKGSSTPMFTSQDDVATSLLSSVNAGSTGKLNTTLRKVMRGAVTKAYETTRAYTRVTAASAGKFSFQSKTNAARALGSEHDNDQKLHVGIRTVEYSKGLEGRGNFTEEVDIIALEPLEAVIRAVYNSNEKKDEDEQGDEDNTSGRDMLKSMFMAQVSPRVFWSLLFHHPTIRSSDDALRQLCPTLDWSFLDQGRSRQLSAKARDNLHQERVRKGLVKSKEEESKKAKENQEAAIRAVQAVEEAMEKMHSYDVDQRRQRAANAAIARFDNLKEDTSNGGKEEKEWKFITPSDDDIDELKECILEGSNRNDVHLESPKNGLSRNEKFADDHAHILLDSFKIRNWRELANVEPTTLYKMFQTRGSKGQDCYTNLSENEIERWIEEAQERSLEEIMMEIVMPDRPHANDEAEIIVNNLRERARAGTPKDLMSWRAIPHFLLEQMKEEDHATPSLSSVESTVNTIQNEEMSRDQQQETSKFMNGLDESDVRRWCSRAEVALSNCPWLQWYATPVE